MLPFPRLSLVLLSSLLACAAGGGQSAPWASEIRVYNPTGWQRNVRAAADVWNRTGVAPKFVFVHDARHAQVTVTASTEAVAARCRETYTCDASLDETASVERLAPHPSGARCSRPRSSGSSFTSSVTCSASATKCITCADEHRHRGPSLRRPALPSGTYPCGPLRRDILAAERLYGNRTDPATDPGAPHIDLELTASHQ